MQIITWIITGTGAEYQSDPGSQKTYLASYGVSTYVTIQKNEDILSIMSNLQPNGRSKVDLLITEEIEGPPQHK